MNNISEINKTEQGKMNRIPPTGMMVYNSVEEILDIRERISTRIDKFEVAIRIRSDFLKEQKRYLYFEKEIDYFLSLLDDLIDAIPEENLDDLDNVQAKICKHEDIEAEVAARENELINLEQIGLDMIRNFNKNSPSITKKIHEMKVKWQTLLAKLTDQIEILRTKQHYVDYVRTYEKILRWIDKKTNFLTTRNHFRSLGSIEQYIYDFSQLERKVFRMETEVEELKSTSDFFIKDELPQSYNVSQRKEKLSYSWAVLKDIVSTKRIQLMEFIRVHKLCCRVDEFLAWVAQKDAFFSNNDYGENLEELLVLLKKYEGTERILDELENRLDEILEEHDSLCTIHRIHTEGILVDKGTIEQKWQELEMKAVKRGQQLRTHSKMHKFFIDINCAIQAFCEMKSILSTERLTEKVNNAEVNLQMLKIYKKIIESREDDLDEICRSGNQLLLDQHRTGEIAEKLEELKHWRQSVNDLLESQEQRFGLLLGLQMLDHDCDAADNWLAQKEAFLVLDEDLLTTVDDVQEAIERHEEFEQIFKNEKWRVESIIRSRIELPMEFKAEADNLLKKREEFKSKLKSLELQKEKNYKFLKDTMKLQLFYSDCYDVERWIIEKLKILYNDSYMDGSIISRSIASHNLFVNEFTDYSKVIHALVEKEKDMIQEGHYAASAIEKRVKGIVDAWNSLSFETHDKTQILDRIFEAQMFLLITTKIEIDLTECEERLENQYVFHDEEISSVLRVEINLEELHREVKAIQRPIHNMQITGNKLLRMRHENSRNIAKKIRRLTGRYRGLTFNTERKLRTIKEARKAGVLYMEIEDQVSWMKEKISSMSIIHIQLGLLDVQKLTSKYKINSVQMDIREKEIKNMKRAAIEMITTNHYDSHEIRVRMRILLDTWRQLKEKYEQFEFKLEEARRIYNYYAEAELDEAVLIENLYIMKNNYFGFDEDSSASLLRRHDVIFDDLRAFGKKIEELQEQAENCKQTPPSGSSEYQGESVVIVENLIAGIPNKLSFINSDAQTLVKPSDQIWCGIDRQDHQKYLSGDYSDRDSADSIYSDSGCPVLKRQADLQKLYNNVMKLAEIRRRNLVNTHEAFTILREASQLKLWIEIKEAYAQEENVGEDIAQVEVLQRAFDDFQSELAEKKINLIGILTKTEKLHPSLQGGELADTLLNITEELKSRMKNLQELAKKRDLQLSTAHELQRFYRDIYDVEDWMLEKDKQLDNDDCGDSLKTVRTLLRKHEGLERDLDALDDKISHLDRTARILVEKYSETANEIVAMQTRISEKWEKVSTKATFRKQNLLDSYDLQKFFADYDSLMSWINKMMLVFSNEDKTNDFQSAILLMNSFERDVSEIEKNEIRVKTVQKFGEMLLNYNRNMRNVIENKLELLRLDFEILQQKKISRQIFLQQNLQVNAFLGKCEKMECWLKDKEKLLNTSGESEKLVKIHKKLEEFILKKQEEVLALEESAHKLVTYCQDDTERIMDKCNEVISHWKNFKDAHSTKRSELRETQTIKQFSLEAADIENWIDEKIQQALQETYRDPVNIKSKLVKYKAFQAEIEANKKRIENVLDNGYELMENEKTEKLQAAVRKRLENISSQWDFLKQKTKETSEKFEEVSKQYEHILAIKSINFWMGEIETLMMNQDLGKSLETVRKLLAQQTVIENDIKSHSAQIEDLQKEVDMFTSDSIFDIVSVKEEHKSLIARYARIEELAQQRRNRLEKKSTVNKYLNTIAMNETWIRNTVLWLDNKDQPVFEVDKAQPLYRWSKGKHRLQGPIEGIL